MTNRFRAGTATLLFLGAMITMPAPAHAVAYISMSTRLDSPGVAESFARNSGEPGFTSQRSISVSQNGARATTSVDLVTGSIRGIIDTRGTSQRGSFSTGIDETFQFNVANAQSDTVTLVGLRVYFAGNIISSGGTEINFGTFIRSNGYPRGGYGVVLVNMIAGKLFARGTGFNYPNLPVTDNGSGNISGTFDNILYFSIIGANSDVNISSGVDAQASGDNLVDFGNSAHLGFVLPENVSFTSSSGNAFTASAFPSTGAIPEPATWAMMIIGFGAAGSMIRRRRAVLA